MPIAVDDKAPAAEQAEVIAFLSEPSTFGQGLTVERHETHGALVFLVGGLAYKLKRAVHYPYMDYSTRNLRRSMCEAEFAVNRRTAPGLYLRVQPIVRDLTGALRFGTNAEADVALDWVVVMRRFPQNALLGEMCKHGELSEALARDVAEAIAAFHERTEQRHDFGGAKSISRVIDENAEVLTSFADRAFDPALLGRFDELVRQALCAVTPLLEERRAAGFVRRCHGDLHLNNICVLNGTPLLFDAIEFSEDFSYIDVLYDFAFLLMDLDQRSRRDLANIMLNRYLEITADYGGIRALPIFLSCRAAIRAHVTAATAELHANESGGQTEQAAALLDSAIEYLQPRPATLVVTAGYSGSGKSTLARALAREIGVAPGAIILRSDVIRKRLFGVDELTKLPQEAYSAEITVKVYSAIAARARLLLSGGHSVIADAVYGVATERQAIEAIATQTGSRFCAFWLEAPARVLEERLDSRTHDASDATGEVLRMQFARLNRPASWHYLDAGFALEDTLQKARAFLNQ